MSASATQNHPKNTTEASEDANRVGDQASPTPISGDRRGGLFTAQYPVGLNGTTIHKEMEARNGHTEEHDEAA
ncbi:hypothetical protein [Arthrobacter psychrochitiniphilus]|uniref:hypothetical protein n=1 Tax=Arthrobacter psychrochitiniphilus TaxID=291045 RepID=UPI003F7BE08E